MDQHVFEVPPVASSIPPSHSRRTAYPAFHDRVIGRPDWATQDVHASRGEHRVARGRELGVTMAKTQPVHPFMRQCPRATRTSRLARVSSDASMQAGTLCSARKSATEPRPEKLQAAAFMAVLFDRCRWRKLLQLQGYDLLRVMSQPVQEHLDHHTTTDHPLIIGLDATLLDAHSDKETTGLRAPVNCWRCCCGRVTPARSPPPTCGCRKRGRRC